MNARFQILGVLLGASLLAAGCAQKNAVTKPDPSAAAKPDPSTVTQPPTGVLVTAAAEQPPVPEAPHDPAAIYFGFDSSDLDAPARAEVERIAGELRQDRTLRLRVEGNCDDVGTVEYNLALGQKRADAAKRQLERLGIDAARVETTSWGKERPKYLGTDEASRAMNRRADFLYRMPGEQVSAGR